MRYDRVNGPVRRSTSRRPRCSSSTRSAATTRSTHQPGVGALIAVVADAGSGNDTLTGGDESDTFFGGLGNDTLDPRPRRRRRGRRPGRQRHAAGPRRRRPTSPAAAPAPTPRQADREDVLADVENADVPPAPPAADTTGHRGARRRRKRDHVEAQEGRLHGEDPRRVPGLRGRRLQGHPRPADRAHGATSAARASTRRAREQALHAAQRADQDPQGQAAQGRPRAQPPRHASLNAITTNRDAAGNLAQRSSRLAIKLVR